MTETDRGINASKLDEAISMLKQYLDTEELAPLLAVLGELAKHPDDEALLAHLSDVVGDLGVLQGAALTYAPILVGLLSDDPFGD